jgi:hypothetical protein
MPRAVSQSCFSRHLTHALSALCLSRKKLARENTLSLVEKLCRTKITCGRSRKNDSRVLTRLKTAGGELGIAHFSMPRPSTFLRVISKGIHRRFRQEFALTSKVLFRQSQSPLRRRNDLLFLSATTNKGAGCPKADFVRYHPESLTCSDFHLGLTPPIDSHRAHFLVSKLTHACKETL